MGMNFNLKNKKGETVERYVHSDYRYKNEGETYGVVRYKGKDRVIRYDESTNESYIAEEAEY